MGSAESHVVVVPHTGIKRQMNMDTESLVNKSLALLVH
jgi:hypothetical protein